VTMRLLGGAALCALLACGGCGKGDQAGSVPEERATPRTALDEESGPSDIVTVDVNHDTDPSLGATPMAQRVAVLGLLNKRNGVTRDLTLKPGQAVRVGDVVVRMRACEQTAPWEPQQLTGSFVQLSVQNAERKWQRVFSGWLYKEQPALNVVIHPIYDVWTKSCAMTFPGVPAGGAAPSDDASPAATRSSRARNAPRSTSPTPSPSASASDTI
jgi:hypothetical protein